MSGLSQSPARDKAAVLSEAAKSNSARDSARQNTNFNAGTFAPVPTAASSTQPSGLSSALNAENKRSGLSMLINVNDNSSHHSASSSSSFHHPSLSLNLQTPSPAPLGARQFNPSMENMYHAVSAYQHALLTAAVSLHTNQNPSAPTPPLGAINTSSCIGNHVFAGRITGPIDLFAFHTCIQALVNRHSALRTSFQQVAADRSSSSLSTAEDNGTASSTSPMNVSPNSGMKFAQLVRPSDAVAANFRHSPVDADEAYPPVSQLTSLRLENLSPTLGNMIERAAYEPFNVAEDASLFRVRLFQIVGERRTAKEDPSKAGKVKAAPIEECTLFVFSLSALVGDIWSMTVLLDDFRVLYAGSINMPHLDLSIGPSGVMDPAARITLEDLSEQVLEPLVMDYIVYSEWQKTRFLNAAPDDIISPTGVTAAIDQAAKFISFWAEHLSGTLPVLSLPNLVERPHLADADVASAGGDQTLPSFTSVPFVIPQALTKRLISLATSERTELNSLLISAFQLFLFRYTGQDDVLLGGQASCRANLETQNVVGPFSNAVLYRSNTSGNHVFRTYLQSTRSQIIGVRAHSDYSFPLLLQKLADAQQINAATSIFPTLGSSNLFAASFDFEYPESSRFTDSLIYTVAAFASGVHGPATHVGGLKLQPLEIGVSRNMVSPFDAAPLALKMSEVGGELRGHLRYDSRTYNRDLMARMCSHWETLLSNIVANPDVKVSDLNLLNGLEKRLLLHDWNQTATVHLPQQIYKHNVSKAKLLHQWVEHQASMTPDALAIEYIDPVTQAVEKWTYKELNAKANQVAHYIRYLGVQPDQPVPIILNRSPKLVLSLFAALKAGAAAMPLDPTVPNERIKFLLHQSEAVLVISETTHFERVFSLFDEDRLRYNQVNAQLLHKEESKIDEGDDEEKEDDTVVAVMGSPSAHAPSTAKHPVYLLNLDTESELINTGNTSNLPTNITPSFLAYILFTSGSTGTPKGVMLTHQNLVNYITWFIAEYGILPSDRAAHTANMAFDASMMETWPTLCRGAAIIQGANDDIKLVPSKFVNWMNTHKVTFTFLTTQLCHQFLEATYPADFSLRYLFTGGDRLNRGPREEAPFKLVNVYGPTETTINVTVHTVPNGMTTPPPIGRPVANTQLYIVDSYMQPVPLGLCGELMIGGLGVGRGYFGRPDLTAEKFIPNPFYHISPQALLVDGAKSPDSKDDSEKENTSVKDPSIYSHSPVLYRTGDLVRYRSDGILEFVGRADQQVKIRGYRIEMAEIESAILAHPMVSEICVIVTEQNKEKKLLAYIVTKDQKEQNNAAKLANPGAALQPCQLLPPPVPYAEFKKFLRERLPSYMIPSVLLYLSYMPLTNNGKIHRQILPIPDWNDEGVLRTLGQTSSDSYVAPSTNVEKLLVRIVRTLLNMPRSKRASMSDNLLDLGVHSLMIGQLISKIDSRIGVELHYSKVFESPSLQALAKTVQGMLGSRAVELTPDEIAEESEAAMGSDEAGLTSPPLINNQAHAPDALKPLANNSSAATSNGNSSPSPLSTAPIVPSSQMNGMKRLSIQTMINTAPTCPPLQAPGLVPKFQIRTNTPYRLSYNQSSLLFLSELDPSGLSSLAYNIPFVARLHAGPGQVWGPRNERALERAFETLLERHTILRTIFPKRGAAGKENEFAAPAASPSPIDPASEMPRTPGTGHSRSINSSPFRPPTINSNLSGAEEEASVLLSAADLAAGVAHQVVLETSDPRAKLDFEVVDGIEKGWNEKDVKRFCVEQTYRIFDLNNGPMTRIRLVKYATEKSSTGTSAPSSRSTSRSSAIVSPLASAQQEANTVLLWTVHHIAVDLWSMVILIEELKMLYAAYLAQSGDKPGAMVVVPQLTPSNELLQYVHCIPSQLSLLQGAKAEKLWSYWLTQLAEPLPTINLPTDKPRPHKQTYKGTSYTFPIPQRLHSGLTSLAREEGVTMYTLLLSAFYTLLHVYSGQEDLIVGSPLACRNDGTREGVVGYFVNALPLRSNLAGNPSFRSYVARVKQMVLGALSNQELPLPLLAQRVLQGKERDASRTPIWQVLFILQKPHRQALAEQGLALYFMNSPGVEMNLGPALHMESVQVGGVDDDDVDDDLEDGKPVSPKPKLYHSHTGGAGGQRHAQFDLALICGDTSRELQGAFHFNTDLYELSTIQRMSEHFVTLLESIVNNPSAKLSSLSVLPQKERDVLLNDWCSTVSYDKPKLIHQLVEAQAAVRPDALAVVGKDARLNNVEQRLSYSQLNSRANQLASYLRFAGANLETPCFVLLHRTPLFIVTLLACLKSGAAYVPIDPSYPLLRITHIMEQAEAAPAPPSDSEVPVNTPPGPDGFAIILTERSLVDKIPALTGGKSRFKLLFVDDLESQVRMYGNTHNLPLLEGQNSSSCMSMVFTSGSTGKPKGVQIMHKALHSYCAWWNPYLESGPHDRVSHLANVGFDASMTETWATLTCGASVWLCSDEVVRLTPSLFVEWVTKNGITVAFLPTVLTEAFLDQPYPPEMKLRCLYTGGDKLHRGPRVGSPFRLICCYGPCESTIGVTATDVPVGMNAPPFNIGKPQPNVQILILDPNQKLLPIGTIGEMCIGGQQLARGYYNKPDLTRNAFIQNPFMKSAATTAAANALKIGEEEGGNKETNSILSEQETYSTSAVLYRTGDLARYLPDGSLEFWGRADFQVKIRGNRIELGEIEVALRECEAIHDVVVVARTDSIPSKVPGGKATEGEKKIVAYYVMKPNETPVDATFLRTLVKDKLPDFMVPSAFVMLPALPLTPNGKVDRDALPAPKVDDLQTKAHLAARNEVEIQLAALVSQVLGVPKISMLDDFFELGGHSLAAAQLLARIRDALGVDLPLGKIFEASSIGALAEAIEVLRAAPSIETRASLVPAIPGTPGSVPAPQTPLMAGAGSLPTGSNTSGTPGTQRSALLAQRMKAKTVTPNLSSGSPQPSAGKLVPPSPSRNSAASPSVNSTRSESSPVDNQNPILNSSIAGPVRLGSSPSKSTGLATFLAHKAQGGHASSRAAGGVGSGTSTPTSAAAKLQSNMPFAAPTLGFNRGNDALNKLSTKDGSDDDEEENGSPYQRLNFLNNSRGGKNRLNAPESPRSVSGSNTPNAALGSSPTARPFAKRLAKLRNDSPSATPEHSLVRDSESRRDSVSKFGTPDMSHSPSFMIDDADVMRPGDSPMTYSQASLWFVNKLDPNSVTYTCVYGVELKKPYDARVLQDAVYALVVRHPSLRTRFIEVQDEPVQRVTPSEHTKLDFERRSILDGLGHDAEERERHPHESDEDWQKRVKKALKQLLMKENHIPFDIKLNVFRARLFTLDEAGSSVTPHGVIPGISYGVLHLMASHIAVDGWSMEVLVNELYTIYTELYHERHDDALSEKPKSVYDEISSILSKSLPPITHTMCDRATQERNMLASPEGERCWNFWQRTLAPPLPLIEIHTDFTRPPIQTYKGDVFHFSLPEETIIGLRALAKGEKVTMFMVCFTSFLILLHRYTGQEDLAVGTPMACRTDMNFEHTVGHFVNSVVLRANLSGDVTTLELLDRVKRLTINAFVNQDFPFPLLVDRLQSFRDSSRNPLFQVLFSLNQKFQQGVVQPELSSHGGKDLSVLDVEPLMDLDQLVSPFDLQLIMTETENDLKADLTYNTSLFTHQTMQRMSTHLLELWKGMVSNPREKVGKLKMLPKSEYDLIVTGFNTPLHSLEQYYMVDVPKPPVLEALCNPDRAFEELHLKNKYDRFELLSEKHCVHRLFELQTRLTPGATAVVEYESFPKRNAAPAAASATAAKKSARPASLFPTPAPGPQVFTYAKLNARANSLANYMREALGVRVGDVVVLLFFRCADWLTALLAALKCGAAYLPVDPAYPADRIRYMMQDAKAKVLLTHSKAYDVLASIHPQVAAVASLDAQARSTQQFKGVFPPQLPETNSSVVMVDVQWDDIALFDQINPDVPVTMQHLCYLVYTSGSTGRPKGVMIAHRSMYLIARWHQLEYNVTENDRVTQQTAPAFDPVGLELWSTWFSGASLHIVPDSVRSSPPALQQFMIQTACTIAFMPTPICANMLEEPWPADRSQVALRVLSTGGDRLLRGPQPDNPLPPQTRFDNWYGPSENTIISTFFHIPSGYTGAPPIGRAVDNVRLYIVDRFMKPVPIGVPGEIYVGGDCLATGYLNRAELSAEKFRPDIFLCSDEELMQIARDEEEKKKADEAAAANPSAQPESSASPATVASPARPSVSGARSSVSSPATPFVVNGKVKGAPAPFIPSFPRMYESGDIGRFLPDGSIDFIGRKDFQVKIRGFRIELGEIETALARHPRVGKVVVQVKSKGQGHQALAAYVVLVSTHAADGKPELSGQAMIDELRSFTKQTLPEYMVPSVFVFMKSLPETANGKIDLKALPEPDWGVGASATAAAVVVEPRNEIETKLCAIWCNLLNLQSISIHDNFFELGGNSLTAARLLSAIKRQLEVELNVSLLFHAPTVAGVADKIAFLKREGSLAEYVSPTASSPNGDASTPNPAASSSSAASPTAIIDSFDAKKEIVLDASICNPKFDYRQLTAATAGPRVSPVLHHPKVIFLTGVTGFLGVHLLAGLLLQTNATVYCHVRMGGNEKGTPLEKILKNVAKFKLFDVSAASALVQRVVPVLGDLSAVRLGISAPQWSMLSTKVDGIIHCGAYVNSVLPYSQLKAANVGGTHEVLRLATAGGKLKPVHHISTLSVFQSSYQHKITELEPLTADGLSSSTGYPTSKFVADSLILQAARRGIPVAIYRPGRITGHSKTGLTSLDDFFTRLLKGCVQLGAFPDLDWNCDLTPVDWMAYSIVHLATNPHPTISAQTAEAYGYPLQPCSIYHLHNPKVIHWVKLCEWLIQKHKYPCQLLKYEDWLAKLRNAVSDDAKPSNELTAGNSSTGIPRISSHPNVLAPLMTVFGPKREDMGTVEVMPSFNSKYTGEAIVKAKYHGCPEPNDQLLETYMKAFHSINFM